MSSNFRKNLWDLQQNHRFTDVTLEVGNDRYDCHRNVLISNNGYFYDLFMRGFEEENSAEIKIRVPDPNNNFIFILQYLYTNDVSFLTFANSFSVMVLASYFQLDDLVTKCQNYFFSSFDSEKNTGEDIEQGVSSLIDTLVNKFVPLSFNDRFNDTVASHIEYFMKNEQFFQISENLLKTFLSRACLRIPSEVFLARWLDQYVENTGIQGNTLNKYIRWQFLEEDDWGTFDYRKFCDDRFKALTLRNRRECLRYEIPPVIALSINARNYQDTLNALYRYTTVKINAFDKLKLINNHTFINNNSNLLVDGLNSNPLRIKLKTTFDKSGGIYLDNLHVTMTATKGIVLLSYNMKDSIDSLVYGSDVQPVKQRSKDKKIEFDVNFQKNMAFNNLVISFTSEDNRQIRIDSMTVSGFVFDKKKLP